MDADFPAAHSMDTDWFAVDRYGFVATFSSGEAGAVPSGVAPDSHYQLLDDLKAAVTPVDPVYDLDALIGPDGGAEGHHIRVPEPGSRGGALAFADYLSRLLAARPEPGTGPVLMFLSSTDPVLAEIAQGLARTVPSRPAIAVLFNDLPVATARRVHAAGACLGCFRDYEYDQLPSQLGLYRYDHPDELYIPEPYRRHGRPLQLLHVDQLPAALRDTLMRVRFDAIGFDDEESIQPIEHFPCATWNSAAYLPTGRRIIRPIPGQEERYREEFEAEYQHFDDVEIEPPPPEGGQPPAP
jgi:hypothetical protein